MQTKFIKLFIVAVLFLCFGFTVKSATHTVTNGNDAGTGSLRQTVLDANSGDTIIFAPNVFDVYLVDDDIIINKDLTIIGGTGDNKVTIYAGSQRIFYIDVDCELVINNLILTGANHRSWGGAVYMDNGTFIATNCIFSNNMAGRLGGALMMIFSNFTATNCIFSNNTADNCGAVCVDEQSVFTATNCIFSNNTADSSGGGAVFVHDATFVAMNCIFSNNTAGRYGGAVSVTESFFTAINCSFSNNTATGDNYSGYSDGGAVNVLFSGIFVAVNCNFSANRAKGGGAIYMLLSQTYMYHSTFDNNKSDIIGTGAVWVDIGSTLYTYNSIYTRCGLLGGEGILGGENLIEGINGVTHEKVFGNNEYTDGYIMPLEFARSATPLTKFDIEVPEGMDADDIIFWLLTDQRGEPRSSNTVTFGAVEFDGVGIKEDGCFDILVLPNITDRDFTIIFDNPETQTVSIELIDLEGKTIFSIHEGTVNSGIQVYRVNENLANGIYFVKFVFKNKVMVRKVIVRK